MTLEQRIARQKKIKAMIADERSYSYIAKRFGISRERVGQIARHDYAAKKKLKGEPPSPPKTKK